MKHCYFKTTANQSNRHIGELGVGLIEVMIALFILAFAVLALGNMQASSLVAVNVSSKHLDVNSISEEILEHLKADPVQAGLGAYDTLFEETEAAGGVTPARAGIINGWKSRTATLLPEGTAQVACIVTECTVSLRWREAIVPGSTHQTFNLKVPLEIN